MKNNEEIIILEGVFTIFDKWNRGRIYSQCSDKQLIEMKQKMKQKQRREKLKNII